MTGEPLLEVRDLNVWFKADDGSRVHAVRGVSFTLDAHDLSYWNDAANGWVVPPGGFRVYVGDSSALSGLPLRGAFTVTGSG